MRNAILTSACFVLVGCTAEHRYVVENETVVLTDDAAPVFEEDDEQLFLAERTFEFDIKEPPVRDTAALAQMMMLPYPGVPFVEMQDISYELDYVIANLESEPVVAGLLINGLNEYFEYTPGPQDFSQWERRVALEPKQRIHGTLTELDFEEIATDLATVVNGAPNSNEVVHPNSQSFRDERVKPFIPTVIAGLVGVRVGVSSNTPANVAVEISVRAIDRGDRVPKRGEEKWDFPAPMPFVPVVPVEAQ